MPYASFNHTRMRICSGFTLLELLVVVLIIAIASSTLLITFTPQTSRSTATDTQLLTLLQRMHSYAVDEKRIVGVHIGEDAVRISTKSQTDDDAIYADAKSWNYRDTVEVKTIAQIDYRNLISWREMPLQLQAQNNQVNTTQTTTNNDATNEAPSLPTIIILPTGEIIPTGTLDILGENDIHNASITWDEGRFLLLE